MNPSVQRLICAADVSVEDALEVVAAGLALLLAQNYIVTNAFFGEKEIRQYLLLRRQFHDSFAQACVTLAQAFEEGSFGPGVKPAAPALRAIGRLTPKQDQQALRQMSRAFRGLKHLGYDDVDNPRLMRLLALARRIDLAEEIAPWAVKDFLGALVRVPVIPARLRTLLRKVLKMPVPGSFLSDTANPGQWFDMPADRQEGLRELASRTLRERDEAWEKYRDDPEARQKAYKDTARRLQKIQNVAGVNLDIIKRDQESEPLDAVLKKESRLDIDGPSEYTRARLEDHIRTWGTYFVTRKKPEEGSSVPREVGKVLTQLRRAKTFPTMQRVVKEAIARRVLGPSSDEDIDNIIAETTKNRAIKEGKPLAPLQFAPMTLEEFKAAHDCGEVELDPEYTEEQQQVLLGRVSRAIDDLECVYGKGFCGKHAKKLAFRFNKGFRSTSSAHYFTWDDKREWQPRVTFGPEYEGLLAHELSHYLEDLLSYRIEKQVNPERAAESEAKGWGAGSGIIFGRTGVPLSRFGAGGSLEGSRQHIGSVVPEFVEFVDAVLATPDYKRWEDKLGTAYDTALPGAIKKLTGIDYYDLPKDHPYAGLIERAKYRSDLPPEVNEAVASYFTNLMDGDNRKLNYYNSATEVWARMCEQYVYNRLIEGGVSNPWLTQMHYEEDIFMDEETFDEKVRPVMDRLFARLKERSLVATDLLTAFKVAARYQAYGSLSLKVAARYQEKKKVPKANGKGTTEVYVYSERQVENRNREKAKRLQKFKGKVEKLRAKVKADLGSEDRKTRLVALAVALIDETHERVGNEASANGDRNDSGEPHYGVTGWKKSHVKLGPNSATIKYVGKSGVKQDKTVSTPYILKALRRACEEAEGDLFSSDEVTVTADEVNQFLKPYGITAKDLRGLAANGLMQKALKRHRKGELPAEKKEREAKLKAEFKQALEDVSEELGHEASTLKSQYLAPNMETAYLKDGTIIDKLDE